MKWFAEVFHDFAATLDSGDCARQVADIAQVAAVLEDAYAPPAPPAPPGVATPELALA